MKFGSLPLSDAVGAILAHTTHLPGGAIKKGTQLTRNHLDRLATAGRDTVIAAVLEPGDVPEDEAANRIAKLIMGDNLERADAFTGRANLFAQADGLVRIDTNRLIALNKIDQGLTIATLAPFARVTAGKMVATVKIIPFALPEATVARAEEMLAADPHPLVSIAAFTPHHAHLVLTALPGSKPSVIRKRGTAIEKRLDACGSRVDAVDQVDHDVDAISGAVQAALQGSADPILVFGASAIVDPDDVIPAGIRAAGGTVHHIGMPVDPGNLLLLGEIDGRTVIGVPSCASSPKTNGLDWVLERTLAGLPVTSDDLAEMAVGGLLMEIQSRPQPREQAASPDHTPPRITPLVLAAGRSTRMGKRNKLLEELRGKTLIQHVVDTARAAKTDGPVIVVTGHESNRVRDTLAEPGIIFVQNDAYAEGLATSLIAGLKAVPDTADGVIVLLGDMPDITAAQLDMLIAAFSTRGPGSIVMPTYQGRRGNPIIWARRYFPDMQKLSGDVGAKSLLSDYPADIKEVELDAIAVLKDIDTPEALERARAEATDRGTDPSAPGADR